MDVRQQFYYFWDNLNYIDRFRTIEQHKLY